MQLSTTQSAQQQLQTSTAGISTVHSVQSLQDVPRSDATKLHTLAATPGTSKLHRLQSTTQCAQQQLRTSTACANTVDSVRIYEAADRTDVSKPQAPVATPSSAALQKKLSTTQTSQTAQQQLQTSTVAAVNSSQPEQARPRSQHMHEASQTISTAPDELHNQKQQQHLPADPEQREAAVPTACTAERPVRKPLAALGTQGATQGQTDPEHKQAHAATPEPLQHQGIGASARSGLSESVIHSQQQAPAVTAGNADSNHYRAHTSTADTLLAIFIGILCRNCWGC